MICINVKNAKKVELNSKKVVLWWRHGGENLKWGELMVVVGVVRMEKFNPHKQNE